MPSFQDWSGLFPAHRPLVILYLGHGIPSEEVFNLLDLRSQAFQPGLCFADVLLRLCFVRIQLRDLSTDGDLCVQDLTCGKNYPTLKKLKSLFNQLYDYARMHDIVSKDYSEFVDISRYKDQNPNKRDRTPFAKDEIKRLWEMAEDPYYQIILMLIYNSCRISEFLDLKKEHVHLDEQYFDVIASKTENDIRKVPIADKVLPFYRAWYEGSTCEYLLHTPEQNHFDYRNYYDSYFISLMEQLGFEH